MNFKRICNNICNATMFVYWKKASIKTAVVTRINLLYKKPNIIYTSCTNSDIIWLKSIYTNSYVIAFYIAVSQARLLFKQVRFICPVFKVCLTKVGSLVVVDGTTTCCSPTILHTIQNAVCIIRRCHPFVQFVSVQYHWVALSKVSETAID